MIAFPCSQCGMKFRVKPVFAGRASRCPTCKHALVVPTPDRTQAVIPAGQIDGTKSSLAAAKLDAGVTLGQGTDGSRSLQQLLARRSGHAQKYLVEDEIARGGMGAVLRAVDCDIRREVAVKYLLDQTDPTKKLRFVEEAQITGQLEHPNIVPIHELGVDGQGRLFFAMKMVRGRSLKDVLDRHREDPKAAEKGWPLGRLLTILVNVCNAVGSAHSRGVVHRDLKPANVMLGDFGEVYVMDWGLAKVRGTASATSPPPAANGSGSATSPVAVNRESEADLTQDGAIVGTPVYMPPEQARGDVAAIDARSDVYALGAILYEMLTLQPPVETEGGYPAILWQVMEGKVVPPEQRTPRRARAGKISKELSAVALKALAKEPATRYPTVEALRRDIERFQEGRSVSARSDSFGEAAWRLVRRNRALSLVLFVSVLAVAVVWGRSSWRSVQDQRARRAEARKAVPVFVRAARQSAAERQFEDALAQVDVALKYEPGFGEARLLRGLLLLTRLAFVEGAAELERYTRAITRKRPRSPRSET